MARTVLVLACSLLLFAPSSHAFAPAGVARVGMPLRGKSVSARSARVTPAKMAMDPSQLSHIADGAQTFLSTLDTVPFIDEVTGEPQGFTSPKNHFASVIGLWVLFALPVWSAAYKQAGCTTPDWFGVSQVAEDAPGVGLLAKAAPEYNGPSFREGLEYVFSFVWKPPILIAWKPRADLDRDAMDPARDTVVSSLYKGLGGALDKTAVYDEEDQLLILSDIVTFEETDLGRRREKIAEASGWYTGNPSFGRSLIEYSEQTRKGKRDQGTVTISTEELAKLRAEAAKK